MWHRHRPAERDFQPHDTATPCRGVNGLPGKLPPLGTHCSDVAPLNARDRTRARSLRRLAQLLAPPGEHSFQFGNGLRARSLGHTERRCVLACIHQVGAAQAGRARERQRHRRTRAYTHTSDMLNDVGLLRPCLYTVSARSSNFCGETPRPSSNARGKGANRQTHHHARSRPVS